MRARIIGTGRAVPSLVVHNRDFEKFLETTDEWISERTGMKERHIAVSETALSLGVEAARKAIAASEILPEEIDIILCSTATPDTVYPNMACQIQKQLGNTSAMCCDINAACTGFIYASAMAQAFISSGMAAKVLVVASELTSKNLDYTDRSSCVLFGDGAAAAIFSASETAGIIESVLHSDGRKSDSIVMKGRPVANYWTKKAVSEEKTAEGEADGKDCIGCDEDKGNCQKDFLAMDGKSVYAFATRTVPESVSKLLDKSGLSVESIDWFVFHQANGRMLEVIAKKLGIPMEKVPINVGSYGNTSSASIPILIDEMARDGRLKAGDKIVMSGFGAGLTWGALLMEW